MSALKWIVKEAKAIKKQYPKRFAKWTDYVAQASAIYAKKHKGVSPVGKKKAVKKVETKKAIKKTATKKAVGKYVKTVRKGKVTDVIYKRKKVGAVKKSATTMHKDTASHNVKISVMSGLNNNILKRLQEVQKEIEQRENVIKSVRLRKIELTMRNGKNWYTKWIKDAKAIVSELKKHKTELKRFL
jgi:hypothetical protein